jgi:hypothetical protein
MKEVAEPLIKSDKLSDLSLSRSALYELVEIQSRGELRDDDGNAYTVTKEDMAAVLKEAAENWIGPKRLMEILKSRHPETAEALDEEPDGVNGVTGEAALGEADGTAGPTKDVGEVADDEGAKSPETPPAPVPKPKAAPSAKDEGNLLTFKTTMKNLKRLTSGPAEKYATAAVQISDLKTAAEFLLAVADEKEKQSAGNSTSAEKSAVHRRQYYDEDKAA